MGQKDNGLSGDINDDGVVNILDLVRVSARFGETETTIPEAPGVRKEQRSLFPTPIVVPITPETIQEWIDMTYVADDGSPAFRQGIANLKRLLVTPIPTATTLLQNYPNPFNPETWIPYHLANDANVKLAIYDTKGVLVRLFNLDHQKAGYYTDRTKAVYWDGRSETGEQVASGAYFYQLTVGNRSTMRKMVILK